MTKEKLQEIIENWTNTVGSQKIAKNNLDPKEVSREIYVYIYYAGNDMISKDEGINSSYEKVNILLQFLPTNTRNWVVFRIRPEPMGEPFDSEVKEKTLSICQKYLDMRVKHKDRLEATNV